MYIGFSYLRNVIPREVPLCNNICNKYINNIYITFVIVVATVNHVPTTYELDINVIPYLFFCFVFF